jgi:aspartate oxidase
MPAISGLPGDQASSVSDSYTIVIVGSGLAGCTAALQLRKSLAGARAEVVLLEKESRPGGNSQKASSGISILSPENGDSEEQFIEDCLASGRGLCVSELVEALVVSRHSTAQITTDGDTNAYHFLLREDRISFLSLDYYRRINFGVNCVSFIR